MLLDDDFLWQAERYKTELIQGLLDVSFEIIDHIVMKGQSMSIEFSFRASIGQETYWSLLMYRAL